MEGAANNDARRRSTLINRLHTTPRMTIRELPTPQTTRTAADSPSAKAPAFEIVHAAIDWNAQAASDQSTRRTNITDQLSA